MIDSWYENSMISISNKLEDTVWCNDNTFGSVSGDYKYLINNDGLSATLTEYFGGDVDVIVPDEIDGYTVTALSKTFYN